MFVTAKNGMVKGNEMKRPKEPVIPHERHETIRQAIVSLLTGKTLSAREISGIVRISEKEVYEHLEHIRKGIHHSGQRVIITPAMCRRCGFVFKKRDRLKRPGKCPVCRSEMVTEPLFSIG